MFWSSSNQSGGTHMSQEVQLRKTIHAAGYGLPPGSEEEPVHFVPGSAPLPANAPVKDKAMPTPGERIDKMWVDAHISNIQELFATLQKSVNERLKEAESHVETVSRKSHSNAESIKRLQASCTHLENELKRITRMQKSGPPRSQLQESSSAASSPGMLTEVRAAVQFLQDTTLGRMDELSQVQRNLNSYVRDCFGRIRQEFIGINKKLLNLSLSSSLFSLEVRDMSSVQIEKSLARLERERSRLFGFSRKVNWTDPTNTVDFSLIEEALSAASVAGEIRVPTAEASLQASESRFLASLLLPSAADEGLQSTLEQEPTTTTNFSSEGPPSEQADLDVLKLADSKKPGDQQGHEVATAHANSDDLQTLDTRSIDLGKSFRAKSAAIIEKNLQAIRAQHCNLYDASHLAAIPTEAAFKSLEAMISENGFHRNVRISSPVCEVERPLEAPEGMHSHDMQAREAAEPVKSHLEHCASAEQCDLLPGKEAAALAGREETAPMRRHGEGDVEEVCHHAWM
eukprot:TRINITY_DN58693_c0_g1_i1.p1 TRINITY_DN58693_c0_g1~~TRINITY_DN58693_c0_g1_i1.p1  ORF type:complete len:514 (+),score=88.58 TRINITY_DN58693_c0_g1_i1:49-1590(+)